MQIATKGIVLRQVKYGETSVIVSVFTELLGLQSYLVKGVRNDKRKGQKANFFRPGNILDLQVNHQDGKQLQFIKEFQLAYFFKTIGDDVIKNTILLFAIDVLNNMVLNDECQTELFEFSCDFIHLIDTAPTNYLANYPFYFIKEAAKTQGYAIADNHSTKNCFLNTYEGYFQENLSIDSPVFDEVISAKYATLLSCSSTDTLNKIHLNPEERRKILEGFIHFLQWHDKSFKTLRSLPILQAILH